MITPKVPVPRVFPGLLKLTLLKTLKNSVRNCNFVLSVILKSFEIPRSTSKRRGFPRNAFFAIFPKVPIGRIGYKQACIEEFRDHLTMRSIAQYGLLEVRAREIRAIFANSAKRVIATAKESERKAALPGHNGSYGPAVQQIPANAA